MALLSSKCSEGLSVSHSACPTGACCDPCIRATCLSAISPWSVGRCSGLAQAWDSMRLPQRADCPQQMFAGSSHHRRLVGAR